MPPGLSSKRLQENLIFGSRVMQLENNATKESDISFGNISNIPMNCVHEKPLLCAVKLAMDRDRALVNKPDDNTPLYLGTVCVDDAKSKLDEFRQLLTAEVPAVPQSFVFDSREGWPISKKQECILTAAHVISKESVICIRKHFEKKKFGIVFAGGNPLGFVFADINSDIRQLRELIEQQLKIGQQIKSEYRFLEHNGWPIMQPQEPLLSVMDIIVGHTIYIQNYDKTAEGTKVNQPSSVAFGGNECSENCIQDSSDNSIRRKKSSKLFRPETKLSVKMRKGSQKWRKTMKEDRDLTKPILLSYVRAEAAQYALDLKQELVRAGHKVFLDVHEIKTGTDWQDSLNEAVMTCFLFVPLITPMYGRTQWTNREIKLADVLKKMILPINFMDAWPPACLAIQFASTQFIPWKVQENDHVKGSFEKPSDSRMWPKTQQLRVAKMIEECYRDHGEQPEDKKALTRKLTLLPKLRSTILRGTLPSNDLHFSNYEEVFPELKVIVISAHPKQKALSRELKVLLEKESYQVWCSCDWHEEYETLSLEDKTSIPNTPRDLPTISEDKVFFNQQDQEVFYDANKKITPTSRDIETYGRRPLSRMLSQFSDINQPSKLSQDQVKMLSIFQQKVDQAGVVIVLVTEEYSKSTFSQEQVFYCEQRKQMVLVKCDNSMIPAWLKLLMRNDMIMKENNSQFECVLKARVKRALNPSSSETPKDATFEAKINYLVNYLKCNLPLEETRLYVTGSSKLQTQRSEEICRAIGKELSYMHGISLVTGGFYGAADITAKTLHEQHAQMNTDDPVVHILPILESEDIKSKARQNPDGSFEAMSYGKTFFVGDSLKERETVVARLLDMCIVIEGGPGVVHEVEEFIWNDRFVIPIHSTGGAAGGKFGIPMKIFEVPPGVNKDDWSVLSEQDASPDSVAKAVLNIIFSLRKTVASPTNTLKSTSCANQKQKKKLKKQKSKIVIADPSDVVDANSSIQISSDSEMIKDGKHAKLSSQPHREITFTKRRWWHRLLRLFRR